MEKIIITIDTVNAAFDDEPASEIARILRVIAKQFEDCGEPSRIIDGNGNRVGTVQIIPQ